MKVTREIRLGVEVWILTVDGKELYSCMSEAGMRTFLMTLLVTKKG